jgi:hypothetical protein
MERNFSTLIADFIGNSVGHRALNVATNSLDELLTRLVDLEVVITGNKAFG